MRRISPSFWVIVILGIAGFAAVSVHSRRISRPLEETTYIPAKEVITPEIELLRAYLRIDTSNPPGRELEGARFLVEELARRGVRAEMIVSAPGRANVYARLKGRREGDGLLLLNHIDVFPAGGEAWSEPPFGATIKMNMLYGRGSLDMKSTAICELLAFAEVASSGRVPECDLVFLATVDEETGGDLGIAWLLEHRPDVIEGIGYALNEGGISETLEDRLTNVGIEVGSRQFVSLKLRAKDRRSLERTRSALLPYQHPRDPTRVLPELPGILRDASRSRKQYGELLADVEKTIANGDFFRLPEAYRALFVNSAFLDGIEASAGGGFEMSVFLSNLPDELPGNAIATIRRHAAPFGVEVDVLAMQGPAPISSWDTPLFSAIREAVAEQYGKDIVVGPIILPFSSNDSRYLRTRGIEAYGISPFPVSLYQTAGIHGVDERIRLDWFVDGATLTRRIVTRFAFGQ